MTLNELSKGSLSQENGVEVNEIRSELTDEAPANQIMQDKIFVSNCSDPQKRAIVFIQFLDSMNLGNKNDWKILASKNKKNVKGTNKINQNMIK